MNQQAWTIIANAQILIEETLALFPLTENLLVCDGAYTYTQHLPIDVVLGDFDSLQKPKNNQKKRLFIEITDQNTTDLQKSIEYCDLHQASSITIINALDNQMSHSLHNLSLLKRMHRPNRPLVLRHPITDNNPKYPCSGIESIYYLHNQSVELEGLVNSSVSLFGFASCLASSQGLVWDLANSQLDLSVIDSSRNRLAQPHAHITVEGDALLILDHNIKSYSAGKESINR